MKKFLIVILVLGLLVGCSTNESLENTNSGGAGTEEEVTNESSENTSNTQENIEEEIKEDISVKSTITFPSKDGLLITADTYIIDETSDFMVLFHQAEMSRGEYIDTALRFNELGYNVMAVDQRSGLTVNDVLNETAKRAKEEGYPISWADAGMDIQASIEYVRDEFKCNSMYILGSSYSASLVLSIAPEYKTILKGVICFSPSDKVKWNEKSVKEILKDSNLPIFMTSKKREIVFVEDLFQHVTSDIKVHYKPETSGRHGSIALWDSVKDSHQYWEALIAFLEDTKN
ncbi:MAG: alpha/beta hydrolase [Clostridiales bacterium]|nr:alpha/beta hydrolase [Clostridiales bacterium]